MWMHAVEKLSKKKIVMRKVVALTCFALMLALPSYADKVTFKMYVGESVARVSVGAEYLVTANGMTETNPHVTVIWARPIGANQVLKGSEVLPCTFEVNTLGTLGQGKLVVAGKGLGSNEGNTVIEIWNLNQPLVQTSPVTGELELIPQGVGSTSVIQNNADPRKQDIRWIHRFSGVTDRFLACYQGGDVWEIHADGSSFRLAASVDGFQSSVVVDNTRDYSPLFTNDHLDHGRYAMLVSDVPGDDFWLLLDANRDSLMDGAQLLPDSAIDTMSLFDPSKHLPQQLGVPFCSPADPNSSGQPAVLTASLNPSSGSTIHLDVSQGVQGDFCYFLIGTGVSDPGLPIGDGHLCLAITGVDQFGRYNVIGTALDSVGVFDASGNLENLTNTAQSGYGYDVPSWIPSIGGVVLHGQTWNFQGWYRSSSTGVSNFTNGLTITF